MAHSFYTVGHSTRSIAEFAALLSLASIRLVLDVRTVPRSRTNPQYNSDTLPEALAKFNIAYRHMAAMGLRGKAKDVSPDVNAFWENESFHNYADYALSAPFHAALKELRALGREQSCAIMCAEALWWRCHRRIIADYLIAAGETVSHILGKDHIEPARMTPAARQRSDGLLTYPAKATDED